MATLAAPARAANFSIDPTTVTLSRPTYGNLPSADVVVRNVGETTTRFTVHAYEWSQTLDEAEHKVETDHVVYYPQQFALAPGASQRIRIGIKDPQAASERAYRLIVAELPPPRFAGTGLAGLSFYTKVDLPLFLDPAFHSPTALRIDRVTQGRQTLDVVLANDGNTHIAPSVVAVTWRNRAGHVLSRDDVHVFYVLAQGQQAVHFPIPSACRDLGDAVIQWSGKGTPYKSEVAPLRADLCTR